MKRVLKWIGIGMGGFFVLILVLAIFIGEEPPDEAVADANTPTPTATPSIEWPDRFSAQVMCEEFVKRQLRAPSTADFPSNREWNIAEGAVENDERTYIASAYVDAQNAFGATLRSRIACELRYRPHLTGKEWLAVDVIISE